MSAESAARLQEVQGFNDVFNLGLTHMDAQTECERQKNGENYGDVDEEKAFG